MRTQYVAGTDAAGFREWWSASGWTSNIAEAARYDNRRDAHRAIADAFGVEFALNSSVLVAVDDRRGAA